MSDDKTGTTEAAQGAAEATAQGATAPAQGAQPAEAQGAAGQPEGESVEALRTKLTAMEKDNRSYRQREREREDAEKQKAKDELPEMERLQAENAELKEANATLTSGAQEQSLRTATSEAAAKLGFRNPSIAVRALDRSAITFDDKGAPVGVDAQLKALAESDPYLLAATDFGGGQRGSSPASKGDDMNARIRRAAGKR